MLIIHDLVAHGVTALEPVLVFDLGHSYKVKQREQATDPEGAILENLRTIGVDNVIHVHLSDNSGSGDEHGFLKRSIEVKRVLQGLHDRGYRGLAIVRSTEMERFGQRNARNPNFPPYPITGLQLPIAWRPDSFALSPPLCCPRCIQ